MKKKDEEGGAEFHLEREGRKVIKGA